MLYLKYAWYLAKLLEEISGFQGDAQKLLEKIKKEEDSNARASIMTLSGPPITPPRNSVFFGSELKIGSVSLKTTNLGQNSSSISSHISHTFDKPKKRVQIQE